MTPIDVRCDRVSKRYSVPAPLAVAGAGVFERFAQGFKTPDRDFWALRDVSFDVPRGATLGVVGRNGAGKSTLLKLLGGITAPSEGQITLLGRLSAMIEVGSGFHPELTGRENVFLSGAILGMRRRDIAARLDSIADFSGVAAFLDTPVKHYSSGMYVRLGFAIAAHLEPEILLVDEVLAVGDAEFQARCIQRILDLKRRGTTMLLVSHDLGAVEQLSDRAILIDGGRVTASGAPHDVIGAYQRRVAGPETQEAFTEGADAIRPAVRVLRVSLEDLEGAPLLTATAGAPLVARVSLALQIRAAVTVRLSVYSFDEGTLVTECIGDLEPADGAVPGEAELHFIMPELLLAPGAYTLGVTATLQGEARPRAWRFGRTTLYVQGTSRTKGVFVQPFACRVVASAQVPAGTVPRP